MEQEQQQEQERRKEVVQGLLRSEGWVEAKGVLNGIIEDAGNDLVGQTSDNLRDYGYSQGVISGLTLFHNELIKIAEEDKDG